MQALTLHSGGIGLGPLSIFYFQPSRSSILYNLDLQFQDLAFRIALLHFRNQVRVDIQKR